MGDAMKLGYRHMERNILKKKEDVHGMTKKDKALIQERSALFAYQQAAVGIVTKSPTLTMKDHKMWERGIGTPDSKVQLPSGDEYYTKVLNSKNKHASNNRLVSCTTNNTEQLPLDGMKTNLEINFSRQSLQLNHLYTVTGRNHQL